MTFPTLAPTLETFPAFCAMPPPSSSPRTKATTCAASEGNEGNEGGECTRQQSEGVCGSKARRSFFRLALRSKRMRSFR